MRLLFLALLLLPLAACKTTNNEPMPQPPADTTGGATPERPGGMDPNAPIEVRGTLTDEGVECQALRAAETSQLFTLTGDLGGFKTGDRVRVRGTMAEISFCQQGTTLSVQHIEAWEE